MCNVLSVDGALGGDIAETSLAVTALGYLSVDERTAYRASPSSSHLRIKIPALSKFAVGCLSVGIGDEGDEAVTALAAAPWFSHLRQAAQGPVCGTTQQAPSILDTVLRKIPGPHIVSVALPSQPDRVEVDAACAMARQMRQRGAFVVVTISRPNREAVVGLGQAFDCMIEGDGSLHHHWYPARTVTEPATGRLICYDLYDVCSLWAGRRGMFGAVVPNADGLHVEVSTEVETLLEVDRLVSATAAGLDDMMRLCLFNAVAGGRSGATAVSFLNDTLVRQERAPARHDHKEESNERDGPDDELGIL